MSKAEKMIRETGEISKKLNEKNYEIFTDIVCYLRVSSVEEEEQEDIISDILDMFLRCQEEHKSVQEAIGSDYKGFCDSIIESVNQKKFTLHKACRYFKPAIEGTIILLTIDLLGNYMPRAIINKKVIRYGFKASFFLTTVIILAVSIIIVQYFGKNSFKFRKTKERKKQNFIFGALYAAFIYLMGVLTYKLSKYELFSVNANIIFSIVGIYWFIKLIKKIKYQIHSKANFRKN